MVFIALNIKRGLERVFNYKDFPSGFLISYFTICVCCAVLSCSVISDSLWPHGLQPTRLLCPWGFSRQKYWSGLPWLPPGDLPNPGNEPRSQTLQADSLLSEPPGKLKNTGVGILLERIEAYPFSMGSSQPRNQSRVSCITGEFFTSWATRGQGWFMVNPQILKGDWQWLLLNSY